jgi:hypothetical protein
MRRSLTLLAVSVAGLIGCASPDPTAPEGLNISNRAPGTIEGTFRTGDNVITFSSVADGVVTSRFEFRDAVVTYVNDQTAGTGSVTGAGELSASDHELTLAFVDALGKQFIQEVNSEDELAPAEFMLDRMASHLAIAPVGNELTSHKYESARDVRYLSCAYQPTYLYQSYTGQWWYAWTGQGGGNCRGRCGVGCGYDNTYWFRWGTGVYSQDCALHDYGLQDWYYATDDYAASSNCKSGI